MVNQIDKIKKAVVQWEEGLRPPVLATELRDSYTRGHTERVAGHVTQPAKEQGKGERFCWELFLTGLPHDPGKVGISDDILLRYVADHLVKNVGAYRGSADIQSRVNDLFRGYADRFYVANFSHREDYLRQKVEELIGQSSTRCGVTVVARSYRAVEAAGADKILKEIGHLL